MPEGISAGDPTPAEIVSALKRTGFLLEQRVAQKIREAGFEAITNEAFPDPEDGRSREIDVLGITTDGVSVNKVTMSVVGEMIIECKNTSNPLVVVGTRGEEWHSNDESIVVAFDPYRLGFPTKPHGSIKNELGLQRVPGYREKDGFVGHQLVRMNRNGNNWRADNNSIYDSILYPLVKARQHRIKQNMLPEEDQSVLLSDYAYVTYIFPVIVTAGPVFAVEVDNETEVEVKLVNWTTLRRSFYSRDLKTELRADVVCFDHFSNYLVARVKATLQNAKSTLAANAHMYDPEWLYGNLGQPTDSAAFEVWLDDFRSPPAR